jgi:tetratricopeptide (TPR) repeat protein
VRRAGRVLATLLLAARATLAEEAPAPSWHTPKAARALEIQRTGDAAALAAFVRQEGPALWFAVDALCARREWDAAKALAEAATGFPTAAALPAYVKRQAELDGQPEVRRAVDAASTAAGADERLRILEEHLDAAPSIPTEALWAFRGQTLWRLDRRADAAEAWDRATSTAEAIGHVEGACWALEVSARSFATVGEHTTALARYDRLADACRRSGDPRCESGANEGAARALEALGRPAEQADRLRRVVGHWETAGVPATLARALAALGSALTDAGEVSEARTVLARARSVGETVGDSDALSRALEESAEHAELTGERRAAVGFLERALVLAQRAGEPRTIVTEMTNLAIVLVHAEERDRASELLERALAITRESGFRDQEAVVLVAQGSLAGERPGTRSRRASTGVRSTSPATAS